MKYCSHCGAEVEDNTQICLNCGCMVEGQFPIYGARSKLNVCALVGFILSVASLVFSYLGLLFNLAGLIVSIVGLVQINKKGGRGKGFAIAGICVGAVLLFFSTLIWSLLIWLVRAIERNGGL